MFDTIYVAAGARAGRKKLAEWEMEQKGIRRCLGALGGESRREVVRASLFRQ